jgi:uncharacterized membrane protein YeaQ/YmgE (transglycosylase-associated protein family)
VVELIGALLFGLVAGFIGRALVPNDAFKNMEGPKSWLVSIVLGLVGAAVGWLIFTGAWGSAMRTYSIGAASSVR